MPQDRSFHSLADTCVFLTGPTASGKTEVGLRIAERIGGEILSLDSIAVYRGMDIGTAKATLAERQRVPHHLIDIADPWEEFSISRFLEAAHQAVADILARNHTPVFVGGTPLYLKALLRGFFVGPPPDWEFRRAVEADVEKYGADKLHDRLRQVDPLTAHRLHPADVRRMTRALEVARQTGQPLSHWQVQFDQFRSAESIRAFAINLPREVLRERIKGRVDLMITAGLIDEVKSLLQTLAQQDRTISRTAATAVGYSETLSHLRNECTLEQAIADIKLHTTQMAKRQRTWLRSLAEVRNIDVTDVNTADEIAGNVCRQIMYVDKLNMGLIQGH
jgi:tRNA dimethylallyltransferase